MVWPHSNVYQNLIERVNTYKPLLNLSTKQSIYKTIIVELIYKTSVPDGSVGKESAGNVEDPGSIPGWGRSPGEGNGNPLQYSCLENSMDRGACWAAVHGVAKSQKRLTNNTSTFTKQLDSQRKQICGCQGWECG